MNFKNNTFLTIGGLALTIAGTIVSAIATNQSQKMTIAKEVSTQIANLNK